VGEIAQSVNVAALQKSLVQKGVWVRLFGHLLYVMPPYILMDEQLGHLRQSVMETLNELYYDVHLIGNNVKFRPDRETLSPKPNDSGQRLYLNCQFSARPSSS